MGVVKAKMQGHVQGFTKQDFLDGKCTKEGFPLGTEVNDEKPMVPKNPVQPKVPKEIPTETSTGKVEVDKKESK